MSVSNIINMYKKASPLDIREGKQWYPMAREFCQSLSDKYGVPLIQVAAVLSALSPRNRWENNLVDTESVIKCFIEGGDIEKVKVRTFHSNRKKALDVLKMGDVSLVQTSNKTRCFLDNIVNKDSTRVTVDTHAHSVYMGERGVKVGISTKKYHQVSHAYIEAASDIGLMPYELQAITWITFRRLERIAK